MVERFLAAGPMRPHEGGCWIYASDYDALDARCRDYKEALTWVIDNFNTFAQPPEHLKGIVDAACLAAMTSDTDMLRDTPETK